MKNAASTFCQCEELINIKFNQIYKMSRINNIEKMFESCKELISLDLSFIETSNVVNMNYMFNNCEKLE